MIGTNILGGFIGVTLLIVLVWLNNVPIPTKRGAKLCGFLGSRWLFGDNV